MVGLRSSGAASIRVGLTFPLLVQSVVNDALLSAAPLSWNVPIYSPYLMREFRNGDNKEAGRVRVGADHVQLIF